ncbi:MAG: hypothetical protein IJ747_09295 [Lachnospiraceae bacterium]|nr:hypothetical protein [Lachnospiraceae bacterium]
MHKISEHLSAVIRRVIFIGFGIQMALGILWMCNAFADMDSFGEGIVCVGQMLLLAGSVYFVLSAYRQEGERVSDARMRVFATGAVVTFPMVLQTLLQPDLRMPAAACLLAVCGCLRRGEQARRKWRLPAVILLCAGLLCGGLREPHTDLLTRLGSRVLWTTMYINYDRLPQEIRDVMDYEQMAEGTYEATGIEHIFLPSLESSVGKAESRVILKQMMSYALEFYRKRILKEIIWDEAGYLAAPVILPLQMAGRAYESYAGWNYRQVLIPAPALGSLYMRGSCLLFAVCLVLRGILAVLARIGEPGRLSAGMRPRLSVVWAVGSSLLLSVWYTMSGSGRMDYKNTIYILCLWLLWMAEGIYRQGSALLCGKEQADDKEQ